MQWCHVFYSLAIVRAAAALTFLGRNTPTLESSLEGVSNETTAWETKLTVSASSSFAPHAGNDECSAKLGKYWQLPLSDISVRHNLIPGATVIFEVGGNIGEDLQQYIWRFPSAKIFSYEPVPALYQMLQQKFGFNPNVKVTPVGVSNVDRLTSFTVGGKHGEGSSATSHANTTLYGQNIFVQLRDVNALLAEVQQWTGKVPDVVSINCEGCEYNVLMRMAQTGWLGKVPFVQLSWHDVGIHNRLGQRCAIESVLWDRYDPVYHAPYGWQGWKLKTAYLQSMTHLVPAFSFLQEDGTKNTDVTDDADEEGASELSEANEGGEQQDKLGSTEEDEQVAVKDIEEASYDVAEQDGDLAQGRR